MNTTHTPGPWSVGGSAGLVNQISILPCIGVVYGAGDEIKANAALIAAAPDMYEALKDLVDDICDREDVDSPSCNPGRKSAVKWARAALAKARGQ